MADYYTKEELQEVKKDYNAETRLEKIVRIQKEQEKERKRLEELERKEAKKEVLSRPLSEKVFNILLEESYPDIDKAH